MDELRNSPPQDGAGEAPATGTPEGYTKVEGYDRKTVELKREYEAQVERKVASDYSHIILAYGVIWTVIAAYGIFLLVRGVKLRSALAQLAAADNLRPRS